MARRSPAMTTPSAVFTATHVVAWVIGIVISPGEVDGQRPSASEELREAGAGIFVSAEEGHRHKWAQATGRSGDGAIRHREGLVARRHLLHPTLGVAEDLGPVAEAQPSAAREPPSPGASVPRPRLMWWATLLASDTTCAMAERPSGSWVCVMASTTGRGSPEVRAMIPPTKSLSTPSTWRSTRTPAGASRRAGPGAGPAARRGAAPGRGPACPRRAGGPRRRRPAGSRRRRAPPGCRPPPPTSPRGPTARRGAGRRRGPRTSSTTAGGWRARWPARCPPRAARPPPGSPPGHARARAPPTPTCAPGSPRWVGLDDGGHPPQVGGVVAALDGEGGGGARQGCDPTGVVEHDLEVEGRVVHRHVRATSAPKGPM